MKPDKATRLWTRNASDELAVANGCRFSKERGETVIKWIEEFCTLYEGEYAGQKMELKDWQYECTMRLFGWTKFSEKWQRWVRRFKQASIWIAKKNKKSPTLAAWGLYLLAGDGEMGQKVFLGAKDGKQSREIAGKHVVEMLLRSGPLQKECVLNRSTMQVTHLPTRSVLLPLSSSNSRTQESKEGINGSVLIDETHVVDREFVDRISRAGISRSEPLHIEVSTAGNNPDGYGHERFQYAEEVIAGKREDEELFAAVYAAPQDLADADLAADPAKYGKLANPAWGHTIDPEEFLKDYERSKGDLRKLLNFKMYRLNIWQKSSNPWLDSAQWAQCKQDYTEEDLLSLECFAGLDLAKTQDMCALVLVFPWEESYRILPYFFLPEQTARDNNHLAPYLTWGRQGLLTLTPGNVVDYGFIRGRFRELAQRFTVRELAYDKLYAEETTQALEQGVVGPAGEQIEEGTGVPRVEFPQTLMHFTGPAKEFERLIISGKLAHNGHPILDWQIGHVQVKADYNQNIRPVKPPKGDHKKIDGVVATLMALGRAMLQPAVATPSVTVF